MGMPAPEEAGKTHGARPTGNRCWVCSHPEAKEWIDRHLAAVGAGAPRASISGIWLLFQEHLGMDLTSEASVGNHLRLHTKGLWTTLVHG